MHTMEAQENKFEKYKIKNNEVLMPWEYSMLWENIELLQNFNYHSGYYVKFLKENT